MLDPKIIIVSALITAIVGCGSGSDSGTTTTTAVTENVNNVAKSAGECFSQSLYQAGKYDVIYNSKGGIIQENITISPLDDKDGINQIKMKKISSGVIQTDKIQISPATGWLELTEREVSEIAREKIIRLKLGTLYSIKLGWFSLREGQTQSFHGNYDFERYTSDLSIKKETIDFKQKMTFVGFKDINVNGVEYNTCHIIDEQVHGVETLIYQVFYQSNTGLPLKQIVVTKGKDGKIISENEATLKSYKFNGTELLN